MRKIISIQKFLRGVEIQLVLFFTDNSARDFRADGGQQKRCVRSSPFCSATHACTLLHHQYHDTDSYWNIAQSDVVPSHHHSLHLKGRLD